MGDGCLLKDDPGSFGVFCHGGLVRDNLHFTYSQARPDAKLVCSNVIFSDLPRSHFGSCVRDLLQFLFNSDDSTIRNDFMADLVFSMYYDNFTRGVSAIDPAIGIFSRSSFIQEFAGQILYGFRLFMHTMEDEKDEERY